MKSYHASFRVFTDKRVSEDLSDRKGGHFYFNMEKELIATFMMIVIASLFIDATLKIKTWKKRLKEKLQKSLRNITGTWTTIGKGTLKKKRR